MLTGHVFENIIEALLVAWILTWFNIDEFVLKALKELFSIEATKASYYFMFLIIGLLASIRLRGN